MKKFKSVLPAKLPKHVPLDRVLEDVHKISIKPGIEPIAMKVYRHSTKEQLLIK